MSASPFNNLFQEDLYQIPGTITVILAKAWTDYTSAEQTLLGKILGSVKVDLSAVRILHIPSITEEKLKNLGAAKVLIFGSQGEMKPYEHIQAQGFSVIKADDLPALDDVKKKNLWIGLRSMFGI